MKGVKLENNANYKKLELLLYGMFAVFYLWLASRIPYTHDDWDWGLPVGIQQLVTGSLNGRYAGNLFEVVMTRSEVLKTLIMGAGYVLLPALLANIVFTGNEKKQILHRIFGFLLSNVLLLSMSREIWQQTYGWIAGYANFGISAIFLALLVKDFLRVFSEDLQAQKAKRGSTVLLGVAALVGQLFLENLALYVVAVSLLVNLIYYGKTKRVSGHYVSVAAGALIGLVITFSSGIYSTLWTKGEAVGQYRQLYINSQTNLMTMAVKCITQFAKMPYKIWADNLWLCIAVLALLSILLVCTKKVTGAKRAGFLAANGLFTCAFVFHNVVVIYNRYYSIGISVVSCCFFLLVAWEVFAMYFKEQKTLFVKLMFVWLSALVVILPLGFTSELGARLFFSSNAFLILFALMLFAQCLEVMPGKKVLQLVIGCACAGLVLYHGYVYYEIGQCKIQRDTIITQALETRADTIRIPLYPHLEYLWCPNPNGDLRMEFFKAFYEIPEEVTVIFEK